MAIVESEVVAAELTLYFTVEELEAMLSNTKLGGYTAVKIKKNGGDTHVTVEMK